MVIPFDTLAATEAMESVGVDPRHARVFAAQILAASRSGDAVTRPELVAALATLKTELLDRINEGQRELADRIAGNQRELASRIAEGERRHSAQIWRLFGGIVAVGGLTVSAVAYLT